MIPVSSHLTFHLYRHATDMRRHFDGLCAMVKQHLGRDPLDGDVYVFINKRRDRMKLLVWDRTGFWLFCKRLEKGTFQIPERNADKVALQLAYEELVMILEGIDLKSVKRRPRYSRPSSHESIRL